MPQALPEVIEELLSTVTRRAWLVNLSGLSAIARDLADEALPAAAGCNIRKVLDAVHQAGVGEGLKRAQEMPKEQKAGLREMLAARDIELKDPWSPYEEAVDRILWLITEAVLNGCRLRGAGT